MSKSEWRNIICEILLYRTQVDNDGDEMFIQATGGIVQTIIARNCKKDIL